MNTVQTRSRSKDQSYRLVRISIAYGVKLMLFLFSVSSIYLVNDTTVYYLNNVAGTDLMLRSMICLADIMISIVLLVLAFAAMILRVNKS